MTASPDHAMPDAAALPAPMDGRLAHEMVNQMADVARAMFALLLVQVPREPFNRDIPLAAIIESQPQLTQALALEVPRESIALSPAPVAAALPIPEDVPAPAPNGPASIVMPTSIAMPSQAVPVVPAVALVPDVAVPVPAPAAPEAPRSMAMLSEIGFLDD